MPSKKLSKSSDIIGVRAKDLRKRIDDLIAANPGKVDLSSLVRTAVEEKLDRIEKGEDPGIKLTIPPKKPLPVDLGEKESPQRGRKAS